MKWIWLALLFSSCAQSHIVLYENARPAASAFVQGDAKNITLKTATCEFHADELMHSPATMAGGQVVTSTTSYLGGLATILRLILPFFP